MNEDVQIKDLQIKDVQVKHVLCCIHLKVNLNFSETSFTPLISDEVLINTSKKKRNSCEMLRFSPLTLR